MPSQCAACMDDISRTTAHVLYPNPRPTPIVGRMFERPPLGTWAHIYPRDRRKHGGAVQGDGNEGLGAEGGDGDEGARPEPVRRAVEVVEDVHLLGLGDAPVGLGACVCPYDCHGTTGILGLRPPPGHASSPHGLQRPAAASRAAAEVRCGHPMRSCDPTGCGDRRRSSHENGLPPGGLRSPPMRCGQPMGRGHRMGSIDPIGCGDPVGCGNDVICGVHVGCGHPSLRPPHRLRATHGGCGQSMRCGDPIGCGIPMSCCHMVCGQPMCCQLFGLQPGCSLRCPPQRLSRRHNWPRTREVASVPQEISFRRPEWPKFCRNRSTLHRHRPKLSRNQTRIGQTWAHTEGIRANCGPNEPDWARFTTAVGHTGTKVFQMLPSPRASDAAIESHESQAMLNCHHPAKPAPEPTPANAWHVDQHPLRRQSKVKRLDQRAIISHFSI